MKLTASHIIVALMAAVIAAFALRWFRQSDTKAAR